MHYSQPAHTATTSTDSPMNITITAPQRRIIMALIAGQSMTSYADEMGLKEKAVQQVLQMARNATGLTTYQLVAHVAADLVRVKLGMA